MIVGMLLMELRLPGNRSLKGKRALVKPLLARLQSRYQVAAAEVEENDRWGSASIGVACVSNSAVHARTVLEQALAFVEQERLEVHVIDYAIEVTHAF